MILMNYVILFQTGFGLIVFAGLLIRLTHLFQQLPTIISSVNPWVILPPGGDLPPQEFHPSYIIQKVPVSVRV